MAWDRVPQSCRLCRTDDDEARENRIKWGCDGPASQPWGEIECVECGGREPDQCTACGGSGRMPMDRCPFTVIRAPERLATDACDLAALGILPAAGGWLDQPATFIDAVRFLLPERERYLAKRRKQDGGR